VVCDNGGHLVALKTADANPTASSREVRLGRLTSAGWSATATWLRAAAHGCTSIPPKAGGTPDAGVLARDRRAPMRRDVHRADRVSRDQEGGSAREILPRNTTSRDPYAILAGERAPIPTPAKAKNLKKPVIDHCRR
jgi:hypothetical protein